MKTIGAKELRLKMNEVFDRVLSGEDIIVNHRFKGPIRLSTVGGSQSLKKSKLAGLKAFDAAPKRKSPFDSRRSMKELYDKSISKKYIN
jgi:antitoxin (DNA-binding transcriptional repressor) of toxin-antitoxin stability system